MSEIKEIVFDPINFEDPAQKQKLNFETKVWEIKNGKKVFTDEETNFMFHQYSQFAPKEIKMKNKTIYIESAKRDWMKIPIFPDQSACAEVEEQINMYDDALAENRSLIFGKFDKLYTHSRSIKEPKEADELEAETADPDKPIKPKFKSLRLKLDMAWNYYLDGERLDNSNSIEVKKEVSKALKNGLDKTKLNSLTFRLTFKDEDGKESKRDVSMADIEQRKDINTKVFYRRPESLPSNVKKVEECTEEELTEFYGKGELQDVSTPEQLDEYYKHGAYIRVIYAPQKVYAAKTKDDNGKRKFSYIFVCKSLDIINVKQQYSSANSSTQYSNYKFGRNKVNQMLIKEDSEEHVPVQAAKTTKSKQVVVEQEQEEEEEVDGEEAEADGEEQEEAEVDEEEVEVEVEADGEVDEEEEDIPVVETKPVAKSRGKVVQVVEQAKPKVAARKTK